MSPATTVTASPRAEARLLSPGIVEIKCLGHLTADDAGYLPRLGRLIDREPNKVCIVFDAMNLDSYSPKFPLAHIDFFRNYHSRLDRIAVAHVLKSISFAIATVSLASNTDIKGFSSMPEALAWLQRR